MTEPKTDRFKEAAEAALIRERETRTVMRATNLVLESRQAIVDGIPHWQHLRDRARKAKYKVLANLPDYLETLEWNLSENGFQVHWAADGEEACRIVLKIARDNRVKRVVKGKSMAAEEIGLREEIIKAGLETVETDLGEYIIELADEPPSHITMPAMHKSRQEIGRLMSEKINIPYTDVPEELTLVAREVLRDRFLEADMGFTGVNFALAETGTLVLVENEGNGRMVTTLPRVVVSLMGLEKVIPGPEDLAPFLTLISPSATGQQAAVYFNFLNGPGGPEGPEQHHVIFLDNGRSKLLSDPVQRPALTCIRCGACLNICPIYRRIGGHSYGWVYPGPIGMALAPAFLGTDKAADLPFATTLCGACRDICPLQIDLPGLFLDWRARIVTDNASLSDRLAFRSASTVMSNPFLYRLFSRAARLVPAVLRGHLPVLNLWAKGRELPRLPWRTFHGIWRKRVKEELPS